MNPVKRYNYREFYRTLFEYGPKLFRAEPAFVELIRMVAEGTDDLWSPDYEGILDDLWEDDPEAAVRECARRWCEVVREQLTELIDAEVGEREIRLEIDDNAVVKLTASALLDIPIESPGADILLRSIITPYGESQEGKLIHSAFVPWRVILSQLQQDWSRAFEIPPHKWEDLIAAAFDEAGYDEVTLTPRSGDGGRDVIAVKNGIGAIRILGSVKAYGPGKLVRYDDVRALLGVLSADLRASKAVLATTSDFPRKLRNDPNIARFMPYRLELLNGIELRRWLLHLAQDTPNKAPAPDGWRRR